MKMRYNTSETHSKFFSLAGWRRSRHAFGLKIISLAITMSFIFPFVTWAFDSRAYATAAHSLLYAQKPLVISPDSGTVTKISAGSGRVVVLIQDLHCSYEVQKHIANMLSQLAEQHGMDLVGVEGAAARVHVDELAKFPNPAVKQQTADYLLRQGKITGPEYYAIVGQHPMVLEGIEEQKLYDANRAAVKSFFNEECEGLLCDLRENLEVLKREIYSAPLRALDAEQQAFRQGELALPKYAAELGSRAQKARLPLQAYPNLGQYLAGQDCGDSEGLSSELEQLDQDLRAGLYTQEAQRELDGWQQRLDVMEKLLNISATPEDLAAWRSRPEAFTARAFAEYLAGRPQAAAVQPVPDSGRLDAYLEQAGAFYTVADQRSLAFVNNLLARMDRHRAQLAAAVIGGYHTDEMTEELQRRGVSFICVKPALKRTDVFNPYFALLQGKRLPLEKLLAKNQNIFSLPTSWPTGDANAAADSLFFPLVRQVAGICTLAQAVLTENISKATDVLAYYHNNMASYLDANPRLSLRWVEAQGRKAIAAFANGITVFVNSDRNSIQAAVEKIDLPNGRAEVWSNPITQTEAGRRLTGNLSWAWLSRIFTGSAARAQESSGQGVNRALKASEAGFLASVAGFALYNLPDIYLRFQDQESQIALTIVGLALGSLVFILYYLRKSIAVNQAYHADPAGQTLIEPLLQYEVFVPDAAGRRRQVLDEVTDGRIRIAGPVRFLNKYLQYTVYGHVRVHEILPWLSEKAVYVLELPAGMTAALWHEAVLPVWHFFFGPEKAGPGPQTLADRNRGILEKRFKIHFADMAPNVSADIFSQDLTDLMQKMQLWLEQGMTPHPLFLVASPAETALLIPVFKKEWHKTARSLINNALQRAAESLADNGRNVQAGRESDLPAEFVEYARSAGLSLAEIQRKYSSAAIWRSLAPIRQIWESYLKGGFATAKGQINALFVQAGKAHRILASNGLITAEDLAKKMEVSVPEAQKILDFLSSLLAEKTELAGIDKARKEGQIVYYLAHPDHADEKARLATQTRKNLSEKYGVVFAEWSARGLATIFSQDPVELEWKVQELLRYNLAPHPLLLAQPREDLRRVIPRIKEAQQREVIKIFTQAVAQSEGYVQNVGLGVVGFNKNWPSGLQEQLWRYGVRLPANLETVPSLVCGRAAPLIEGQLAEFEKKLAGLYGQCLRNIVAENSYISRAHEKIMQGQPVNENSFLQEYGLNTTPEMIRSALNYLASPAAQRSRWAGINRRKDASGQWVYYRMSPNEQRWRAWSDRLRDLTQLPGYLAPISPLDPSKVRTAFSARVGYFAAAAVGLASLPVWGVAVWSILALSGQQIYYPALAPFVISVALGAYLLLAIYAYAVLAISVQRAVYRNFLQPSQTPLNLMEKIILAWQSVGYPVAANGRYRYELALKMLPTQTRAQIEKYQKYQNSLLGLFMLLPGMSRWEPTVTAWAYRRTFDPQLGRLVGPAVRAEQQQRYLEAKYHIRFPEVLPATRNAVFSQDLGKLEDNLKLWLQYRITPHPLMLNREHDLLHITIPVYLRLQKDAVVHICTRALNIAQERQLYQAVAEGRSLGPKVAELPGGFLAVLQRYGIPEQAFINSYSAEILADAVREILPAVAAEEVRQVGTFAQAISRAQAIQRVSDPIRKLLQQKGELTAGQVAEAELIKPELAAQALETLCSPAAEDSPWPGVDKKRLEDGSVVFYVWNNGDSGQAVRTKKYLAEKYGLVFADWAEARLKTIFSQDPQELEAKTRELLVSNLEPHPLLLARPLAELTRIISMILEEQRRAVLEIFTEAVEDAEKQALGVGEGVRGEPEVWPAGLQRILLHYGASLPPDLEKIPPALVNLAEPAIRRQVRLLEKSRLGLYAKVFAQFGFKEKYLAMAYDQMMLEDKTLTAEEFDNQHLLPPDFAAMLLEYLTSPEAEKSEEWGGVGKYKTHRGWEYHRTWRAQDVDLAHQLIMEGQELTVEQLAFRLQARAPYRVIHAQLALEHLVSDEARRTGRWSGVSRRQNKDQSWTYFRDWRRQDVVAARNFLMQGLKLTVAEFAQQANINEPLAALALEHLTKPETQLSPNWGGFNRKQNARGEWVYYRMGQWERLKFMARNHLLQAWLDRQISYLQTPPPILLVLPGGGKRGGGGLWAAIGLVGLAFLALPKAAARTGSEFAGTGQVIQTGAGSPLAAASQAVQTGMDLSLTTAAPAVALGIFAAALVLALIKLFLQQQAELSNTVSMPAAAEDSSRQPKAGQPAQNPVSAGNNQNAGPARAAAEEGVEYNVPQLQRPLLWFRWLPALHGAWMFLLAGLFAVTGAQAANTVTSNTADGVVFLQDLKRNCVPDITAEIFKMGRVGFAPLAAKPDSASLAAWFLGAYTDNTKLGTSEPGNDLVFYLPSSLLAVLQHSQETHSEDWNARLAKALARQMVFYQSRRYHQNTLTRNLALGHIDQALDQANALPERILPLARLRATADFLDSVQGELRLPVAALAGLVTEALLQAEAVTGRTVSPALDLKTLWQGQWLQRGGRAGVQTLLSAATGATDALTRTVLGQWQQAGAKEKSLQGAWAVWALQMRLSNQVEGITQARRLAAQIQVQAGQGIQALAWTGKLDAAEAAELLNLVRAAQKVLTEKSLKATGLEQRLQTLESVLDAMLQGRQPSAEEARVLAGAMAQSLEQAVELGQTAEQKEPRFNVVAGVEAAESGAMKPVIVNMNSKTVPDVNLVRQQAQAGKLPLGSELLTGTAEAPQWIAARAPVAAMQAVQTLARLRVAGIRLPAAARVWLETLAMRLHPAAYISQAAQEIPEALLQDHSASCQELQALRNPDPAAVEAYLNRNDVPLALALRAFVHGERLGQRELGETLARLLPRQAASQEAQALGLLRLSDFTQRLRSLPSLAIGTLEAGHAAWANLDLKTLASRDMMIPAALVSARGAKNILGFVLDQMDWSEAFERNQRSLQLFLRRGLQRFGSAA